MAEATKCPNCGADLPDGTVMCTQCGTNLQTGERFGTKVDDGKKKKKKQTSKAPPTGVIIAVVVIGGGIWALDWQEKRKVKKQNEIRADIADRLANAETAITEKKAGEAVEITTELRSEIEGQMETLSGQSTFVEELQTTLEEKVKPALERAMLARKQQEVEALAMANKRAAEDAKIRQGWARIDGRMVPPNEVKANYRKIKGKHIAITTLQRYGWFYAQGDYRSPRTVYDMDYRQIEGTWRTIDDIKQIRGDVPVGGGWKTEKEVLAGMPSKVITKSHPDGMIGQVTKLPNGSIRFMETYDKPISGVVDVVQRTYLFPQPPRGRSQPTTDRARWLRPGVRLSKSRKSGDFYQVRTSSGKRQSMSGYVAVGDVRIPTEPSTKSFTYPSRMVKIESLASAYRKPLAAMRTERDSARLAQLAKQWETDRELAKWPNYRWKSKRCREMADLIKKKLRPASDREVARALAAKPPTDPRLPGIDMPATKPPAVAKAPTRTTPTKPKTTSTASTRTTRTTPPRTTTKTKTTVRPPKPEPQPQGYVYVAVDKVSVVNNKRETLATVPRGQRLPFFGKSGSWYKVKVSTSTGLQEGWVSAKQVSGTPVAASPPPAAAKGPSVTVTVSEAKVYVSEDGAWKTVAVLKKGDKAPIATTPRNPHGKTHYQITATVGGARVTGYLSRNSAQ